MLAIRILIFLLLFLAFLLFFYQMKKQDVLANVFKITSEAMDDIALKKAREEQRNIILQTSDAQGKIQQLFNKSRNRFLYSRISYLVPGLTYEIWFVLKVFFAVVIYFAVFIISKKQLSAFLFSAIFLAAIYAIESVLAIHYYKVVDRYLLKFVDLLRNFSETNGEITGILHKISMYLPEPFCSVFNECYHEAQTYGNTSAALYAMAAKIENPKFKEIIRNIESCVNYTGNFKSAVASIQTLIMDEQRIKRDKKDIATDAVIEMVVMCGGLFLLMIGADRMMESSSLWSVWGDTLVGKVCLGGILAILAIFVSIISKAER